MTAVPAPAAELPMLLIEVEVTRAERLSPSFIRIEFAAPELADFGVDGPLYDQRIKLVFPHERTGGISDVRDADESWLLTWLERPAEERGHMRTYTVRDVVGSGADTRLVVDLVVHEPHSGPGSRWAASAEVGDRIVLIAPRLGMPFGGIEFAPPTMRDLLLVADETALPAVAATLALLPEDAHGEVFVEVPVAEDCQRFSTPESVRVHWLFREGRPHGQALTAACRRHLGLSAQAPNVAVDDVDPDLWETPVYSSSGEHVENALRVLGGELDELYAWVAGESRMVTALRRALVQEVGVHRQQVAFMGYWREGVAMKS